MVHGLSVIVTKIVEKRYQLLCVPYPCAFFATDQPRDLHGFEGLDMDHITVIVSKADNDGGDSWQKRLCPKLEKLMPENAQGCVDKTGICGKRIMQNL